MPDPTLDELARENARLLDIALAEKERELRYERDYSETLRQQVATLTQEVQRHRSTLRQIRDNPEQPPSWVLKLIDESLGGPGWPLR